MSIVFFFVPPSASCVDFGVARDGMNIFCEKFDRVVTEDVDAISYA